MSEKQHILVIDDEPDIRELLYITISRMGYQCTTASDVKEAKEALQKGVFDLCLTDMKLPDGTGIEIIEYIQHVTPILPVAMITAYGSVETATDAMKAGAFDYVSKPIELEKLRSLISVSLKQGQTDEQLAPLDNSPNLIGQTPAIKKLQVQIGKLAKSQAPVFINGESGSGKELVARMIHAKSNRYDGPFIAVNCGAIPSELVESEFFGHEKGAFTGAVDKKPGLFRSANQGTLFLDEVADLPLQMQVKLLRAIQEKAIRSIGGAEEVPIDVRILSASHKNLPDEIAENRFREDLYYRINVIELNVPSLRQRKEDIIPLAKHILEKLSERYESPLVALSEAAIDRLLSYAFPGNVRELENILERAFTMTDHTLIEADDLLLRTDGQQTLSSDTPNSTEQGAEGSSFVPENAFGDIEGYLGDLEIRILNSALEKTRWNKTAAAELLGISFRAMRYKLKKYEIE
ncbi:Transcriptional regulatory protein ZraR [BD1-7 clade bacterium]|uniref:Transcriptional regulatory protein ZraR n=1 Tax=BD1-7 clade bacterium TaxID=2029982 RepID=A0A5S9PVY8_9GAMM|nr:Transcriptional regulatory protein ZraR [BD1-7 clade bacterium]CAA0109653.1 Transcriptional regulatory protein ZraR [BD1-7 clade bacterium]